MTEDRATLAIEEPRHDVLIVGPYPPPLGGVSTHVKRLSAVLVERGLRVGVLNHFGHQNGSIVIGALHRNPFLYWLRLRSLSAPVVHYHHGRLSTLVATALARQREGCKYIATIHGQDLTRYLDIPVLSQVTRWALRRFNEIIAVSVEIERSIASISGHPPVTILPAYLPPEMGGAAKLPDPAREFISRHGRCLVVAAYRVEPTGGRGDVYGLDVAIESFLRIAAAHPDLGLAIFLAQGPQTGRGKRYLEALMARVREEGMGDRVALYVGRELAPAFTHDVVYLRPSRTDGDAVSIREALDAGRPVIASNVVVRPTGTSIITGQDIGSWCAAIERTLEPGPERRDPAAVPDAAPDHSCARAMLDFYAQRLPPQARERMRDEPQNAAQMARHWSST